MNRKLLGICLLAAVMLGSCAKDDSNATPYVDGKLIEGTWYCKIGKDSSIYIFKEGKATSIYYAFILGMENLKFEGKDDLGYYKLTDSTIVLPSRNDLHLSYRLGKSTKDSLYLRSKLSFWKGFKRLYPIS